MCAPILHPSHSQLILYFRKLLRVNLRRRPGRSLGRLLLIEMASYYENVFEAVVFVTWVFCCKGSTKYCISLSQPCRCATELHPVLGEDFKYTENWAVMNTCRSSVTRQFWSGSTFSAQIYANCEPVLAHLLGCLKLNPYTDIAGDRVQHKKVRATNSIPTLSLYKICKIIYSVILDFVDTGNN